ncbi:MAG: hypothetical protein H0W25_00945 [Acidimicrobiia bacterium]|nr:hypothetical protein [Acidimicrobiia bacterium]
MDLDALVDGSGTGPGGAVADHLAAVGAQGSVVAPGRAAGGNLGEVVLVNGR